MLTKAIIVDKIGNDNHYLVRIPILESAGDTTQSIIEATLSYTPGIIESFKKDDVVIVGFENHSPDSPIIMGRLWLTEDLVDARGYANIESLNVKDYVSLPNNITIGGKDFINISGLLEYLKDRIDSDESSPIESVSWGSITGTLSNQVDLQNALDSKATIDYVDTAIENALGDIESTLTTLDIGSGV